LASLFAPVKDVVLETKPRPARLSRQHLFSAMKSAKSEAVAAVGGGTRRRATVSPGDAPTVVFPGLRVDEWQVARRPPIGAAVFAGPAAAGGSAVFLSIEAAVRTIAADERFLLAVPLEHGLIQRLELPEAPAADLTAMARIQLEKVLPYSGDALGLHGVTVPRLPPNGAVATAENAAAALSVFAVQAAPFDRILPLGDPLGALGRWPERVVLHIALLAATVPRATQPSYEPGEDAALLITRENGRTVVGILERGELVFAQGLLPVAGEDLADENEPGAVGDLAAVAALERDLPSLLLGADLESVPTAFRRVWLDARLTGWQSALEQTIHLPVALLPALLPPAATATTGAADLSPPSWSRARLRQVRALRMRRRLYWAAGVYLLILILALADLAWLRWRGHALDRQIAGSVPRVEKVRAARARWNALAPAVDLRQSVVEILEQIRQSLPAGDVRLTLFDLSRLRTPATLTIEGETPNYAAAVELSEKLQSRAELRGFRFTSEPPSNLPNGRARFRISGVLP
jgi:hypothetical protein